MSQEPFAPRFLPPLDRAFSRSEEEPLALTYRFSREELKSLAAWARQNQDKIPKSLYTFFREVQNKVYAGMSIDEFERTYNHENA